jgi:signal transduction histidine kinase
MTAAPITFLLVDDKQENLTALEALLRRDGLLVLTARSGAEALELLLVNDVSLALLDVQMPVMDGFELAELMRGTKRTRNVPIVFVTAGIRDAARIFKGYDAGAVDFLFKPIDPHVLKSKADIFFELARQRQEVAETLRLHEMFVAVLGHDLRNPLAALAMGTDVLRHQLTDEGQLRTLDRMTSASRRMTAMIEQLLDLTRARLAGGLSASWKVEALDVGELVGRAVEELRAAHSAREIALEIEGDCKTRGDSGRLLQLFSNLTGNALHHGLKGCAVGLSVAGEEQSVVVQIHNEGVIPPELMPELFQPFRARGDGYSRPGGLGLGLFISQQVVLAHGGDISVASNTEAGTVFTVRLPRRNA